MFQNSTVNREGGGNLLCKSIAGIRCQLSDMCVASVYAGMYCYII